jgi:hypothetical protein
MNPAPKSHPQYDADDYAYLLAKGWTRQEIVARWNEEAKSGQGPCRWQSHWARVKLNAVTGR